MKILFDVFIYVKFFSKYFQFPLMKALEKEEKDNIKFQYAVGLYKALKDSSFKSYRQLASEAGMESAHMQKIAVGKLDVTLTTSVSIATALRISYTELASYFDGVTEKDIEEFTQYLEDQKQLRGKGKKVDEEKSSRKPK